MTDDWSAPAGHRTVTDAAISTFGWLTGDYSRMHYDHHFAATLPGGAVIAHGLLSASWALGMLRLHGVQRSTADPGLEIHRFEASFKQVVCAGDTLALRYQNQPDDLLRYELLNQRGDCVTAGSLREAAAGDSGAAPPLFDQQLSPQPEPGKVYYAGDMHAAAVGSVPVRTLTETDVVNFASFTGDLDPRYLDAEFACRSQAGQRVVPPMLVFNLSFAAWLRALMRFPMPDDGSAGHLSDRWTVHQPMLIGDTLQIRYQVNDYRESRSRPGQAIVTFGLQMLNQHQQLLQSGEILFLMPTGQDESQVG